MLAAPASTNAPSELSAKATSTRLTRTLALAAVPALALAPPAPSSRVKHLQSNPTKKAPLQGLFFIIRRTLFHTHPLRSHYGPPTAVLQWKAVARPWNTRRGAVPAPLRVFRRGCAASPFLSYRWREAAPVGWVARLRRVPTSAATRCPTRTAHATPRRTTRNPSSPSSRRNSRAIAPRTTARTRNNAAKAFCNGARPFCNAANAFCSGAKPFCSRAMPNAMVRDRFTRLQEGFAMVRGEIARKRQIPVAPQAIKSAGRRLFQ